MLLAKYFLVIINSQLRQFPARNHASCFYHLGLGVCFVQLYHVSLKASHVLEGIRHLRISDTYYIK